MRRILVGYDDSAGARRALQAAIDEAHERRSRIAVVAVAELPLDPQAPRTFGTLGDIGKWEGKALVAPPDVEEHLSAARDQLVEAGVGGELTWAAGEPARAILDAARSVRADVIFLGEHHHGFLGNLFGADVAEEVRREANCDVVLA